ncbi:MAG: beta sliding clamp [Candidatus Westeberhardia cardiocondylae]|nr:beta sliding clamp [Candidatus Westeberhardia cardiocondylae]
MKLIIEKEKLLNPLQQISNAFLNRSTLPILNHLLLEIKNNYLLIIGANLEIEVISKIILYKNYEPGSVTISSKKFFNICRSLPKKSLIFIKKKNEKIFIQSQKSRFSLSTLPVSEFPIVNSEKKLIQILFPTEEILIELIELTKISMANQDVRYYLNGMLLEIKNDEIRSVTTDGHRLSICISSFHTKTSIPFSIIIPRKGVIELFRILKQNKKQPIKLSIGNNNIKIITNNYIFTSKLIDGCFPNYRNILPKNNYITLKVNSVDLKEAISRVSILSNEKFRGIRMQITKNTLKITSNNSNQEEAEETLDISYKNKDIEICLNASYILDILNTLKCKNIKIFLLDEISSIKIENAENKKSFYIVMPMKL